MKRLTLTLFCTLIAFSTLSVRTFADEKGPNATTQPIPPSDKPSSVQTLQVAGQLAAWARSAHDPVGLAIAARVLASDPPQTMNNPNKSAGPSAPTSDAKPAVMDVTPQGLIAEAKRMAGDDKDSLATISQIESKLPAARGHPGGAIMDRDVLAPGGSVTYTIAFVGGQPMEVVVFAPAPGLVEWHVYDENGNEIQSQLSDHFVSMPQWTGPFRVVLTNPTSGYVPYTFATN
jgi:hypothetical protein